MKDFRVLMGETTDSQDDPEKQLAKLQASDNLALRHTGKQPKIIQFEDLPHCGEEVWIANDGKLYRLRRTRQGKLILTK